MKIWLRSLLCISLSLMCLFSGVGYAAISETINISGSAKLELPEGVFITNITDSSDPKNSNLDRNDFSYVHASTTIESIVSRNEAASKGTVEYTVTVFNNTDVTYYFRDIDYQTNLPGYNGNDYIGGYNENTSIIVDCIFEGDTIEAKKLPPRSRIVFKVTYTIGKGLNKELDWKTLINIRFGINVDGESEAIEAIEYRFLKILNTTSTYEQLIDALDNKYDGYNAWTSNYIGNVVGSFNDDSVAVNTLFAGQLQITVAGEPRDATVIIKHENIDWIDSTGDNYVAEHSNGGRYEGTACEMTLYLTIDPLTAGGQYVPVYAIVFTCDRDVNTGEKISDWYRVGNTYLGTANVVTYDGNYGTGSFVTDNWNASAEKYEIIKGYSFNIKGETYKLDSYSYNVGQGDKLNAILNINDATAVTTLQNLLNDAKRILDNKNYAGEGIDKIREVYERYSDLYAVDNKGNHTINDYWPMRTFAKLSPAIENLYRVVNSALTAISELP